MEDRELREMLHRLASDQCDRVNIDQLAIDEALQAIEAKIVEAYEARLLEQIHKLEAPDQINIVLGLIYKMFMKETNATTAKFSCEMNHKDGRAKLEVTAKLSPLKKEKH